MCIVSEFPASFAANQFDDTSMGDKGIAFSHDGRVIVPYLHPDKGFIQVIFYIYICVSPNPYLIVKLIFTVVGKVYPAG
jgi:hypothetical protein